MWKDSDYNGKQRLQYLTFPDGLVYDKLIPDYQTPRLNVMFDLSAYFSKHLAEKKNGPNKIDLVKSAVVDPKLHISNQLIEKFKRIYKLKALIPLENNDKKFRSKRVK